MDKGVENSNFFCQHCGLSRICLPVGLSPEDLARLDQLIGKRLVLRHREDLFRKGNKFHSIFAVRSGSIKTYTTDIEGSEQVLGFHLPGEILGLNAIYSETYPSNAVALETSSICRVPYDEITLLAAKTQNLLKQLLRVMSKEVASETLFLGDYTVEERLAAFLLNLSARFKQRGLSETNFILSMQRSDIANYLRMATETVSRLLTQFQKCGLLKIDYRHIHLLDPEQLKYLARRVLPIS